MAFGGFNSSVDSGQRGRPADGVALLRIKLQTALHSSNQAAGRFSQAKESLSLNPLDSIQDSFAQASDDTVDKDSAQHGTDISKNLASLSQVRSSVFHISKAANANQAKCFEDIQEAGQVLSKLALPESISQNLSSALGFANSSKQSAQVLEHQMTNLSANLAEIESSAFVLRMDEAPTEFSPGKDVSETAKGGAIATKQSSESVKLGSQSADTGLSNQEKVSQLLSASLQLLDQIPEPSQSEPPATPSPSGHEPSPVALAPSGLPPQKLAQLRNDAIHRLELILHGTAGRKP